MSKLKDLITDVRFTLKSTTKTEVQLGRGKTKQEDTYTYECKENGAVVVFHAHPTKAWNWVILEGTNDIGRVVANPVIEKFCKQGAHRARNQTFEEAIQVLKF